MERRWSERRCVAWAARVRGEGATDVTVPVTNVGMEGLFLAATGLTVAAGGEIEVTFVVPVSDGGGREYALACLVVHQQAAGLGVHFRNFHRSLFRDLEEVLYSAPPARGSRAPAPPAVPA